MSSIFAAAAAAADAVAAAAMASEREKRDLCHFPVVVCSTQGAGAGNTGRKRRCDKKKRGGACGVHTVSFSQLLHSECTVGQGNRAWGRSPA